MMRTAATLVLCAMILMSSIEAGANSPEKDDSLVGKNAPMFSSTDLEGAPVVLEKLLASSTLVVLNFWGVRCASCLEEMPSLSEIQKKYSSRGVRVLGVNVDGLDGAKLKELLPKTGVTPAYTLVCDPDFTVADLYKMSVAPLTVILRADGNVAYRHEGFEAGDEKALEAQIMKVLGTAPAGK